MVIQNRNPNRGAITFKTRGEGDKKKVLIYGGDGTGKSTFAEKYCKDNGLNAVVLDIEDTNYTSLPMLTDFDLSSDIKAYRFMKRVLTQIEGMEYDTIIIDGVDSLMEAFISDSNGLKCYADRTKTFLNFLRDCTNTNKNLIFVGQTPLDLEWYNDDETPNKCIVKMNAFVNEKYRCLENFKVETVKFRTFKGDVGKN